MRYHVLPMDLKNAFDRRSDADRRARALAAARFASEARKTARARRARAMLALSYVAAVAACLYFGV